MLRCRLRLRARNVVPLVQGLRKELALASACLKDSILWDSTNLKFYQRFSDKLIFMKSLIIINRTYLCISRPFCSSFALCASRAYSSACCCCCWAASRLSAQSALQGWPGGSPRPGGRERPENNKMYPTYFTDHGYKTIMKFDHRICQIMASRY